MFEPPDSRSSQRPPTPSGGRAPTPPSSSPSISSQKLFPRSDKEERRPTLSSEAQILIKTHSENGGALFASDFFPKMPKTKAGPEKEHRKRGAKAKFAGAKEPSEEPVHDLFIENFTEENQVQNAEEIARNSSVQEEQVEAQLNSEAADLQKEHKFESLLRDKTFHALESKHFSMMVSEEQKKQNVKEFKNFGFENAFESQGRDANRLSDKERLKAKKSKLRREMKKITKNVKDFWVHKSTGVPSVFKKFTGVRKEGAKGVQVCKDLSGKFIK